MLKVKMKILILGVLLGLQFILVSSNSYVQEVFKWKKVDLEHTAFLEKTYVGPYKYHIAENENIASMGYHAASGLMIVVFMRRRPGVPTALGAFCAPEYNLGSSPRIFKFPNYHSNDVRPSDYTFFTDSAGKKQLNPLNTWEHSYYNHVPIIKPYLSLFSKDVQSFGSGFVNDIQRIISIFYITVDDKFDRVFMVDNGRLTYNLNQNETYVIQKPALVVIGLPTNGCSIRNFPILRRVEIPDKITSKGADGFMHVDLDYQPGGSSDDLFLYITNSFYSYLTVYDYKNNDFWAFEHETFLPIGAESHLIFEKTLNYDLPMGIISVALGLPDENGDRMAYYTPLAGVGQYAVSTRVLKNKNKSENYDYLNDFNIMGYRGCNHQSLKTTIDRTYGVMFYGEAQSNQIRCWNTKKPLNPANIGVVYEAEDFNYASGLFVDSLGYLWFISSHAPVILGTNEPLDLNQINTRMYRVKVADAIRGTVCADGLV